MFDAAIVLLVIAGLLVVVAIGQPLAARMRLPSSVLLAAIGVAIGGLPLLPRLLGLTGPFDASINLFASLPVTSVTFIYVFLPLLVFEAGFATDVRRTLDDAAPILLLAVIATVITTAVIGLSLWPLAGLPVVVCLLLGAVVATTDPAAVIAIFRDVGAPARLTRLVEGEALLNDAAAISLFVVLLGMITTGRQPDVAAGLGEFILSFVGGGAFGICMGRVLVSVMSRVGDDRLAEASLTVAFAYLSFIAAERLLHVSGVVAVLGCGLMVSALGRSRIAPTNWTFLSELWEQIAFWARSLIFVLAAILVPRLLVDVGPRDLLLLVVLITAAFAARIFSLFALVPLLERLGFSEPIDRSYKLAIIWGGLRGALTLVLALAVTEDATLGADIRRFVAVLATGFVLFTLFVNGTTLRLVIGLLGLDRLSLRDQALRDRVLALSYAEISQSVRDLAREPTLDEEAIGPVVARYEARVAASAAAEPPLAERDRLAVALVALGNQERALVLETLAGRAASPAVMQVLLDQTDALVEGARADGRLGYRRSADAALAFPAVFRAAYFIYSRFGIVRFLADRLADRVEMLLIMRHGLERLARFNGREIHAIFGERISAITDKIIIQRRKAAGDALDALRRQYPEYTSALEAMLVRQSAMRQELARYENLFHEGLINREVYDSLQQSVADARTAERRPRFDIGLDTRRLIEKLDLLATLDDLQREAVARLLAPRFAVPNERIVRKGDPGDSVFFIASGAVEVMLRERRVRLGTGEIFGEMALLTGQPRLADVMALTYCRLLVLRKLDFDRFMGTNPQAETAIKRVAAERIEMNRAGGLPPVSSP
jgi:CPA1 family monovalent cation:H+ antiporter